MNTHEWHGGARYVGGKVEKAVGDAVDSRDWQVDGIVDQVAGAAENLYGRAQSVAEDAIDAAPHLAAKGREAVTDAADRAADANDQRESLGSGHGFILFERHRHALPRFVAR